MGQRDVSCKTDHREISSQVLEVVLKLLTVVQFHLAHTSCRSSFPHCSKTPSWSRPCCLKGWIRLKNQYPHRSIYIRSP